MRKSVFMLLVIILCFSLVTPVFAQGTTGTKAPGAWVSSVNIQNTGTAAANVSLEFHNPDGTVALTFAVTPTIPVGGSRSLYLPSDVAGLGTGQFSLVVSSDQSLQVVANSSSTGPSTAGSYAGIQPTEIGSPLYFPGLYKNYYGFSSEIVLQNTGTAAATITIEFYNQATGAKAAGADITGSIPASATRVFALADFASIPSGNTNGLLSARVTSSQALAGIANVWSGAYSGEFGSYNGFTAGSTTAVFAPALYKNYYSFVSALTVQNLGSAPADVRISYSNGTVENTTLASFQAKQYYQPANAALPSGNALGVFSAKVESLNSQPIVVLVNVEDKVKGLLASYNGPSVSAASTNCPVVMKSFYGWFSAQTVQNVGTAPTNITITYASGQSKVYNDVAANGTVNIVELAPGSALPDVSSVSAVISSSSQPVVAVVQENSNSRYTTTPGDYLLAYTCVTQ